MCNFCCTFAADFENNERIKSARYNVFERSGSYSLSVAV